MWTALDWQFYAYLIPILVAFVITLGLSAGVADFDSHIEGDVELDGEGHDILSVLGFGKTPLVLVILLLLVLFGGVGLVCWVADVSPYVSFPIAASTSYVGTRWLSKVVAKRMPLLETHSVVPENFLGQKATVILSSGGTGTIQVTLGNDLFQFQFRSEDPVAKGSVVRIVDKDASTGVYNVCLEP
jgi:membrane protein implicated in regulation of membrane protease activity